MMDSKDVSLEAINDSKKHKISYYFYIAIKRLFDIIFGLIGIIFLIPITIILKIAYLCTGDFHSIFFAQKRIGKDGKEFRLYKFRSMIPNAEEKLDELMKTDTDIKNEYTKNKKLKEDPRITKVGCFIRRFSIDELPQFINVFFGQMSIVGPRPYLPREKTDMGSYFDTIVTCKPGLTGLWQVSGRSDISFEARLKLEKKYALERGLWFDIKIFFRTFGAVFGMKGAK